VWDGVPADAVPERAAERTRFLLAHVAAGDRVLDLGCGDGHFAAALAEAGAHVVAVDVAQGAVDRARARLPGLDVRRVTEDAELALDEDGFDVVWLGETLEHAVDTVLLVAEVRRVLRFGGTLLVTTPAHGRLRSAALALRGTAWDAHFDPRADHLRFFSARTLRALLHDGGFPDVRVDAVGGGPLWRAALHAVAR
jgi:2-polyprenyl-3-methyl-5-hydroxy-6-metoxy-1,4-benzoquinol methylase